NSTLPPVCSSSCSRIGWIARHGPHHGAQKSTTTGRAAPSTSASNPASVTSRIASEPTGERRGLEQRHLPDGLDDDRAAHLRMPLRAIGEADRHLDDAEPRAQRPVRRLDLEGVALRVHCVEVDPLEHRTPVALEAAGQVANADAEQYPGIPRSARRDEPPYASPVHDLAAVDVAGAEG